MFDSSDMKIMTFFLFFPLKQALWTNEMKVPFEYLTLKGTFFIYLYFIILFQLKDSNALCIMHISNGVARLSYEGENEQREMQNYGHEDCIYKIKRRKKRKDR